MEVLLTVLDKEVLSVLGDSDVSKIGRNPSPCGDYSPAGDTEHEQRK